MIYSDLRINIFNTVLDLATDEGINASGRDEIYGCIFGRDSAITILKLLNVYKKKNETELLNIAKRALLTLTTLQGKECNIASGEEPGKFIHEYRKDTYEHLLKLEKPWFVYPDGKLRNFDSLDSTPLILIALHTYYAITKDKKFLLTILPSVESGLNWIITYGDKNKDLFLDYEFPKDRTHGGLMVQSWTDSHESMLDSLGRMTKYPIAPIEAQGYAWLALKLWGDFYKTHSPSFSQKLTSQADAMKKEFNKRFIIKDNGLLFGAQAIDGDKTPIRTITANPLLCLWASYNKNGSPESIIEHKFIDDFVNRAFQDDMFVSDAGIRTMSSNSKTFNPNTDSYHNGSFWPMLNGLISEGLENFGYETHARILKAASIQPITYFGTPIELYMTHKEKKYTEYQSPNGQVGCKEQAWSAASILDWLS